MTILFQMVLHKQNPNSYQIANKQKIIGLCLLSTSKNISYFPVGSEHIQQIMIIFRIFVAVI